ncbi:MAG TPA: class I SAM-dependent methyltransferase [Pyrinomonadaceae bacterium]|nr:class I SAM-dependent methyltransferase [Pyrinomonadaceae bacterium]
MKNQIHNPKSTIHNPDEAFEKMDKMYRHQRYFYDLTRKYYLLGRDRLIKEMKISDGENVLEIGCGTARNLIILAKKHRGARFFGLDASAEMLKTAQRKIDAKYLDNITLKTALADTFAFDETFDLTQKFDACFFSYAVSIIPPWKESIENALENLKAGKSLYIVDFYDQKSLPVWFQKTLKVWLKQFHVKYPKELIPFLETLERKGLGKLKLTPLYKRYSLIAEFRKSI